MKDNVDLALDVLATLKAENDKVEDINKQLRALDGGDFSPQISAITSNLETKIMALVDAILEPDATEGHAVGSYWLYEINSMVDGGRIAVEGKEYRIKTIADVMKYVRAMQGEKI